MSTSPPTEALIFDCDGTLADTMPAHYQAWLALLRPLGVDFPEPRFYSLGGMPTRQIATLLLSEAGLLHTVDIGELAERKEAAFVHTLSSVKPIEKVVAIARAHHGKVPMAVASGGYRDIVDKTLSQIGVRAWFPVVVTAEDTPRGKPEPDVFLEAARRLVVDPRICTVYEDTDFGVEAARRAGMKCVDIRRL